MYEVKEPVNSTVTDLFILNQRLFQHYLLYSIL